MPDLTALEKPCSQCVHCISRLLHAAGASRLCAPACSSHPKVQKVAFTGSVATGRAVNVAGAP